jgi:hypothetical protein
VYLELPGDGFPEKPNLQQKENNINTVVTDDLYILPVVK